MVYTNDPIIYAREHWHGDSRDGILENGSGYHYFKIVRKSLIVEAFELYEADDGEEIVSPLPEMKNVDWLKDLGFEDLSDLEIISESHYSEIKDLLHC